VEVIDNPKKCKAVRALNNAEPEAIPLHRIRSRQHKLVPLTWRHLAMPDREKLNVGGVTDSMPNNGFRMSMLEPTVIRLVPTKV
jgi:hypothetical protein